jgi:hypothetical protein
MPGTLRSLTAWLCEVTAYWFVTIVEAVVEEGLGVGERV